MKDDRAQYTEIGRNGQGPYQVSGTIDRAAIRDLVTTGQVPDGAVTTDD